VREGLLSEKSLIIEGLLSEKGLIALGEKSLLSEKPTPISIK
jgi:hypothetical protein